MVNSPMRSARPVTFSVGGVALGTVAAEEVITPVDLVPDGTTDTPAVQNIVRFLMMLDDDGDPGQRHCDIH